MKRVITEPQKSDMGSGFGIYEFEKEDNLYDFLKWYKQCSSAWGTITIFNKHNRLLRKFDFDLYDNEQFYHHLSGWEYDLSLKEIKFSYCFMSEDVEIYLGD